MSSHRKMLTAGKNRQSRREQTVRKYPLEEMRHPVIMVMKKIAMRIPVTKIRIMTGTVTMMTT